MGNLSEQQKPETFEKSPNRFLEPISSDEEESEPTARKTRMRPSSPVIAEAHQCSGLHNIGTSTDNLMDTSEANIIESHLEADSTTINKPIPINIEDEVLPLINLQQNLRRLSVEHRRLISSDFHNDIPNLTWKAKDPCPEGLTEQSRETLRNLPTEHRDFILENFYNGLLEPISSDEEE
ncbi:hypothetical protein L3Y34_012255 [Caenorhabditis briggsae]|nr:hypothetical protein L3Y34_012255 [Caenorhabditis briggsae]